MYKYQWESLTIRTNQQANAFLKLLNEVCPMVGAFDTETTGLHIIHAKPFVYVFGFLHPTELKGYTFAVDIERQPILAHAVIERWQRYAATLQLYLGHNIKYDLHMMTNDGHPYTTENMSDTMFYIRYAHDNLTPEYGGPPLALKDYTAQYINHRAKEAEKRLEHERSSIAKEINMKLRMRLKNHMTLAQLIHFFKDPIHDYTDLPPAIQQHYLTWLATDVPLQIQSKIHGLVHTEDIPYTMNTRELLIEYAHLDVINVLEIHVLLDPILTVRGQRRGLEIENSLIIPLYEMERTGFKVNKTYLENCRVQMKTYIQERRKLLFNLAGQSFTIGQHELIKDILNSDFGLTLNTTNKEELNLVLSDLKHTDPENPAIQFISLIQELRTLEKWYATYILRFLKDLQTTDRLYTTINQVGTVSGRVTSDFQQFPKEGILTEDGTPLFNPREMIEKTGGDYNAIVYLDFSQIELRFQAMYTILVGDPDLNLCRAYMPYQCVDIHNNQFDYHDPNHIRQWNDSWYLMESPTTPWSPTDVHAKTTEEATGLTHDHPDFKKLRTIIGKRVNFAKNYGAQRKRMRQMFPEKTEEEITRINDSYYKAFPGVKTYHQYCYDAAMSLDHVENMFGIGYWGVSGHKLINLLIQGSSAYYLKIKEREIYDYLKRIGALSLWQMQIHDELSWEVHKQDDPEIFKEIKHIMENWSDAIVPIVAEMDVTKTTWSEKKGVTADDLRTALGH